MMGALHANSWREAYAGIVHEQFLNQQNGLERAEAIKKRIEVGSAQIIIAELDQKIVGFADLGASRNPEIADCQLNALYLAPNCFGRGIGTQLINASFSIAKKQKFNSIFVSVLSLNSRAVSFYKKRGGKLIGQDSVIIDGVRYETDTFIWRINPLTAVPEILIREQT
jgi:ribosomal protein S18 acetylase RimI-like enzyme